MSRENSPIENIVFQRKSYRKLGVIGKGRSTDEVLSYCKADDYRENPEAILAVKTEKPTPKEGKDLFYDGPIRVKEVFWWNKIYGKNAAALQGDPDDITVPHTIIMPNVPGFVLSTINYRDLQHFILCIIAAAQAVDVLHKKHHGVHGDLSALNFMIKENGNDAPIASLVDFESTEVIGTPIRIFTPKEDGKKLEKIKESDAPETYLLTPKKGACVKAAANQDYFRFGYLLWDLYHYVVKVRKDFRMDDAFENDTESKKNIVVQGLKATDPASRWHMQKTISVLHVFFIAGRPELPLQWRCDAAEKIDAQRRLLQAEITKKADVVKQEKHDGLLFVLHMTGIMSLPDAIGKAKIVFPSMMKGLLTHRTADVLNSLVATEQQALHV